MQTSSSLITLESLKMELPLQEIYRRADFPDIPEETSPQEDTKT